MQHLPIYIPLIFGITVLTGIAIFYKAANFSKSCLTILLLWMALQIALGLLGFYQINNTFPPRFALLVMPAILFIIILFLGKDGRAFIDSLDISVLTIFSVVRLPVEIVLFWLFINKTIPEIMTFEGRNFDILSGISAPIMYYLFFVKKGLNKNILLIWNFVCLGLLLNVVVHALLSIPSAVQQFAFEQPNIAVTFFPFVLLPSVLVPLVLFSHLVSIRQILKRR